MPLLTARHAWRICLCWLVALSAQTRAQTPEWIIDNTDGGVQRVGSWAVASNVPGFWGSNYLHDRAANKSKSVRFALTLPTNAAYDVYVRWSAAANRATNVPIDIVHATGMTTKLVNQRLNGGSWVAMGSYQLAASGSAVVIRTAGTAGYVIADAVRVVRRSTTGGGGAQPYAGAPRCATHDDRNAHSLWDSLRGCHYDHTHNGDPNQANAVAIFGPAATYLGGKTISYPWQTHNHAGVEENMAKHNGYKWFVDIDLPPLYLKLNWLNSPAPNAVKAIRTQYHFLSTNADARVRLHSFWAEMQVCPTNAMNNCGIVRGGGLWDTGILHAPYKQQWVPVPGQDPANMVGVIFRPGVDTVTNGLTVDPYRGHSHTCQDLGVYTNSVSQTLDNAALWTSAPGVFGYNKHLGVFMKVMDAAECVDPTDINKDVRLCTDGRCRFNGSEHVPFTYWAYVDPTLDGSARDSDSLKNGRVSFRGFTDEHGVIAVNCSAASEHCVPYSLENAPLGWAAWETPSNSGHWPERYRDFDISPAGEYWITLPN
jgi:hypothetical protein